MDFWGYILLMLILFALWKIEAEVKKIRKALEQQAPKKEPPPSDDALERKFRSQLK